MKTPAIRARSARPDSDLGILLLFCLLACLATPGRAADTHRITDVAGRTVEVPVKVERLLLGEGRYLPTLAMFDHDDPVKRVVGMFGEFERLDPASYGAFAERFPALRDVPRVGRSNEASFSIEQAIALTPQVALFGLEGHGPTPHSTEVLDRLAAAGIAVVFIDFRQHPLTNTTRSMTVLGDLLGQPDVATGFNRYYREQLRRVTERVAGIEARPTVFLEDRVGLIQECCHTIARGLFADYIDAAGGLNLAADKVPGQTGMISLEYLLEAQPRVYIGTAIGAVASADKQPERIVLGVGADQAVARASLKHVLRRPGFAGLEAVRQGRAHAIWHHFYNSPFNVVAVQAIAKWLHPEVFADLNPRDTLATLYQRFQPLPLDGEYWVSLDQRPDE
ncbi:ABC transporter substrate-binding protein [Alcanivorax sp. 24]|uniref:ABC transporter substrate-binding protein n=1 Tax=Alcanivorax sp. 24 TaxID=2545266 RepID=UPI00105C4A93|nr:ABC transporter substrate-binding protein [Alcanivorax sp. 24]